MKTKGRHPKDMDLQKEARSKRKVGDSKETVMSQELRKEQIAEKRSGH